MVVVQGNNKSHPTVGIMVVDINRDLKFTPWVRGKTALVYPTLDLTQNLDKYLSIFGHHRLL